MFACSLSLSAPPAEFWVPLDRTCYVQTLSLSPAAFAASLPVGALATAILVVNNTRDIETDRKAGKRTLAVVLGRAGARAEYLGLVAGAYAVLPIYVAYFDRSGFALLPLLSLPLAVRLIGVVRSEVAGPPLNAALADTAKLTLVYSILLAIGWVL